LVLSELARGLLGTSLPIRLSASSNIPSQSSAFIMAPSANKGFNRLIKAAQFSRQGIQLAYQHEEAFRQEVWLAIVLIPLGL
jgi:hypothetical protein